MSGGAPQSSSCILDHIFGMKETEQLLAAKQQQLAALEQELRSVSGVAEQWNQLAQQLELRQHELELGRLLSHSKYEFLPESFHLSFYTVFYKKIPHTVSYFRDGGDVVDIPYWMCCIISVVFIVLDPALFLISDSDPDFDPACFQKGLETANVTFFVLKEDSLSTPNFKYIIIKKIKIVKCNAILIWNTYSDSDSFPDQIWIRIWIQILVRTCK
jgi:hypothetical protein